MTDLPAWLLAVRQQNARNQPAWQRTPEAQPGYTPPRPRPRQMRPAIARLYDPNQGVRDQAGQQIRQERELAALPQRAAGGYSGYADRNQVEEFGRGAMEMTGAPAWARGIQDVQNGRPGEAIPEFLWGALNTAGIATLPLGGGPRLPTRPAPMPLAQALPEPVPSVARPQRPPATASSAAPVRYRFSTEEEGARVYGFDSGGRDYDVILARSPDEGVEVHFTRGGGDSWRQTGDASPFQARAVFSRVLGAVREDAATHGAPVYRFHGMTPEQQALYGSDRARQALDPPQGYRLESDGGGWRWVRTASPDAGQLGVGNIRRVRELDEGHEGAVYEFDNPSGRYNVEIERVEGDTFGVVFDRAGNASEFSPVGSTNVRNARATLRAAVDAIRTDAQAYGRERYTLRGFTEGQRRVYAQMMTRETLPPGYRVRADGDNILIERAPNAGPSRPPPRPRPPPRRPNQ